MGSVANDTVTIKSSSTAFTVAVIGGGIGGLCCAIGLLKYPHIDVQVYESAPSFGEIGAGITVGPNAQRAFELIDQRIKDAFDKQATPNGWASHKNNYTENRVGHGPNAGDVIAWQRNRTGMQCVHRAHLLEELVKLVPAQRAHFGKRLVQIDDHGDDGGCTMHFKDGTTANADAVIGADGVHSFVRKYLLGDSHPAAGPEFAGSATYRGLATMDQAIEAVGAEFAENSIMWCGPGKAILSYPIEHGTLLNVVVMDYEVPAWKDHKWIRPCEFKDLKEMFSGWCETVQRLVGLLDAPDLAAWAMWDMPPAPHYNKGLVCMMGDAAHATTPFQGQGAAQAVEDALVLATVLGATQTATQVPAAFAAFDQVRRPRTQRMVTTSRESGELLGMKAPGIGNDLGKMRARLHTRMNWLWNRNLVNQNEAAVTLLREAL